MRLELGALVAVDLVSEALRAGDQLTLLELLHDVLHHKLGDFLLVGLFLSSLVDELRIFPDANHKALNQGRFDVVHGGRALVSPFFDFHRVHNVFQYYGTEVTESLPAFQLIVSQMVCACLGNAYEFWLSLWVEALLNQRVKPFVSHRTVGAPVLVLCV